MSFSTGRTFSLYSTQTDQSKFLNYCSKICGFPNFAFPQAQSYYNKITEVNSNSYLILSLYQSCHKIQSISLQRVMSDLWFKWHLPGSPRYTGSLDFPLKYRSRESIWTLSREGEDTPKTKRKCLHETHLTKDW